MTLDELVKDAGPLGSAVCMLRNATEGECVVLQSAEVKAVLALLSQQPRVEAAMTAPHSPACTCGRMIAPSVTLANSRANCPVHGRGAPPATPQTPDKATRRAAAEAEFGPIVLEGESVAAQPENCEPDDHAEADYQQYMFHKDAAEAHPEWYSAKPLLCTKCGEPGAFVSPVSGYWAHAEREFGRTHDFDPRNAPPPVGSEPGLEELRQQLETEIAALRNAVNDVGPNAFVHDLRYHLGNYERAAAALAEIGQLRQRVRILDDQAERILATAEQKQREVWTAEAEAKAWRSHCEAAQLRIAALEGALELACRRLHDSPPEQQSVAPPIDWKGHCEAAVTYAEALQGMVGHGWKSAERDNAIEGYRRAVAALAAHSEPAGKEQTP